MSSTTVPDPARRLAAQVAAHESWAQTSDRQARTAPARDARWQRYLDRAAELAPEGATPEDIERRAEHLRTADMKRMALRSVMTRRRNAAARRAAAAAEGS